MIEDEIRRLMLKACDEGNGAEAHRWGRMLIKDTVTNPPNHRCNYIFIK